MTMKELETKLAEKTGTHKKDCKNFYNGLVEVITEALCEDKEEVKVALPGLGTLTAKVRPSRTGRNPRTKEEIIIPASKAVSFKPMPALKKAINEK